MSLPPTLFLSHGAPSLVLEPSPTRDFLVQLGTSAERPSAVVVMSAHWETAAPTVSLLDDAAKLVTSRLGADRFRVAGTAEFNGYNKDIRADRIRPLVDRVNQCFPGVSTRQVVPWAGLRPMMPDMMPRVGPGRRPNVFYNTGHGHLGWTLSAITAHQLAGHVAQWDRLRTAGAGARPALA